MTETLKLYQDRNVKIEGHLSMLTELINSTVKATTISNKLAKKRCRSDDNDDIGDNTFSIDNNSFSTTSSTTTKRARKEIWSIILRSQEEYLASDIVKCYLSQIKYDHPYLESVTAAAKCSDVDQFTNEVGLQVRFSIAERLNERSSKFLRVGGFNDIEFIDNRNSEHEQWFQANYNMDTRTLLENADKPQSNVKTKYRMKKF